MRGRLSDFRRQFAPREGVLGEAAIDDLRLWREAQGNGWLDMAGAGSIRENLTFAAILMKEIGRAGIITPVSETVAAQSVLGFAGPVGVEAEPVMRTLAWGSARGVEDLRECDPADSVRLDRPRGTREIAVPWAHQAGEVIVAARLPGAEALGVLALANPGDRRLVPTGSVLDHDQLGVIPLDETEHKVRWRLAAEPDQLWDGLAASRLLRGWEMLGHAFAAIDLTTSHVTKRAQFGRTLSSMEPVQQRLADMWLALESAELLAAEATCLAAAGRAFRPLAEGAAFACGRAAELVTQSSIHLHGGIGYMWEYDLHWHFRRVKALRIRQGTASQQLGAVATEMLAEVSRLPGPTWTFDERGATPQS